MSDECLFCKIIAGEVPSDKVYEDEHLLAFRDINPVAPSHILIVPRKHIAALDEAQNEDTDILGRLMLAARDIALQENLSTGYRVLTNVGPDGGQAVFHLHLHVMGGKRLNHIG